VETGKLWKPPHPSSDDSMTETWMLGSRDLLGGKDLLGRLGKEDSMECALGPEARYTGCGKS
jgi:hypothetical protein